jgi:hypothetical protein
MIKKVLLSAQKQSITTCKKKELFLKDEGIEIFFRVVLQVLSFLA